jgi:hypothetical protein
MSCRRVLSSTPLLVRVRKPVETAGNGDLQTNTVWLIGIIIIYCVWVILAVAQPAGT